MYCGTCHFHWKQTWKPKRRSNSRKDKRQQQPSKQGPAPERQESKDTEDLDICANKLPWVASTPQSRLFRPTNSIEEEPQLPPAPVLPPPPPVPVQTQKVELTAEEQKILASLQELEAMGIEMSTAQIAMKNKFEQIQQSNTQVKTLSHGHLNKLEKNQKQLNAIAGKISNLDMEWGKFMKDTTAKVMRHAKLYRACREEMQEAYKKKELDFQQIKQETKAASDSLLDKTDQVALLPDAPSTEAQIQALQQAFADATPEGFSMEQVPDAQVVSDDDMEEERVQDLPKEDAKRATRKGATTFRGSPSPTKVANQQLKK